MSYSRTCNPYFVKSLNLGTLTLNGGGEIEDADMLELKKILQNSDINPNFANVLSEVVWVHNMQSLKMFLQDSFNFVQNRVGFPETVPEMSEWQKAIWEDVIDTHSKPWEVQACKNFLILWRQIDNRRGPLLSTNQEDTMSKFLNRNNIESDYAHTLQGKNINIKSALQLNLYISKKQNEVSNRVEISNVTPFERHLWNEIVSKPSR